MGSVRRPLFRDPYDTQRAKDVNNKCQLYHIFLSVFFTQSSVSRYLEGLFFKSKNERCLSGKIRRKICKLPCQKVWYLIFYQMQHTSQIVQSSP